MPYLIVRNDITKLKVDAIVNAANASLLGGGGVDGAIHRAAGPRLLEECRKLGGCDTGKAKITGGYDLPCRYVIHTVGPVWNGGRSGEAALLASCYRESLKLAVENNCATVAFPLISGGVYAYPKEQALKIAIDTIREFLTDNELMVYMVIFDRATVYAGKKLYKEVAEFIDDHYAAAHTDNNREMQRRMVMQSAAVLTDSLREADSYSLEQSADDLMESELVERLRMLDESFSQMVLRKIDEKGITDAACYKKANIDRKLFSKIRSDIHYKPSKRTAVALALALELPLGEVSEMLTKAGYALSHSDKFDVIVEYFILKKEYDIDLINETLFDFDQPLLGA